MYLSVQLLALRCIRAFLRQDRLSFCFALLELISIYVKQLWHGVRSLFGSAMRKYQRNLKC